MLIGIDEVGRGSWAGPLLVVAASSEGKLPLGVADSKTLSRTKRQELISILEAVCIFGEGWVEPCEIDDLGLSEAMRLGVQRALTNLQAVRTADIVIDGNINYCPPEYTNARCLIKADATNPIVSAASIYAKVTRDQRMARLSKSFPGYGFERHVGYGTKIHQEGLKKLGICELHRKSYKPIQAYM